ncbi:hypothetical protein ACH19I_05075 [Yersinia kristensenii]|uniref:hypothetical protein n=1 Tax=Yersinia kristensenii TaxID=28152 RepID=UPI003896BF25
MEPEFQRIFLRDAKAVLGGSSLESQRHCVEYMRYLIRNLIQQGVVDSVDPEGLASLIYGGLAKGAFWIADGDESDTRLTKAITALNLLLRGLRGAG